VIYEREAVIEEVAREMIDNPGNTQAAQEAAARRLGVPIEVVMEAFETEAGGGGVA